MSKQHSEYRHPKHDEMADLIRTGATNVDVARATGANKRAVARVRDIIGVAPWTNATTPQQKLAAYSSEPDADGHQFWTGRTGHSGTPVIRQGHSGYRPAAAVAFELRTGRAPVGQTFADCGVEHCVAPAHVQDDLERRSARLLERALYGMPGPWSICQKGLHHWDTDGRVEPDLTIYCKGCNTERSRKRHRTDNR